MKVLKQSRSVKVLDDEIKAVMECSLMRLASKSGTLNVSLLVTSNATMALEMEVVMTSMTTCLKIAMINSSTDIKTDDEKKYLIAND